MARSSRNGNGSLRTPPAGRWDSSLLDEIIDPPPDRMGPPRTNGAKHPASLPSRTGLAFEHGYSVATPEDNGKSQSVGLWMIGACGAVGSTVALGLAALRKGIVDATGMVSELPSFKHTGLVDPGSLVVGGHEVRSETFSDTVHELHARADLFDQSVMDRCASVLQRMQTHIKTGTLYGSDSTNRKLATRPGLNRERCPAAAIERIAADITDFRRRERLDQVIVVYVASSEPPPPQKAAHASYAKLEKALAKPGSTVLPSSSIYALAAVEARCPFINFTPSLGISAPAIQQRAMQLDVPFMGNDGKTGETLVKSILAPMFAMRNLPVLTWIGHNILGNRDGVVLQDPRIRASKLRSKNKAVKAALAPSSTSLVSIEYAPSLDDRKVAWDFIHFKGFLGTKMSMQFTWQGCDSALAAPLIIDLVRFAALHARSGRGGPMRHLACFFKDPIDVEEQNLFLQWQMLLTHVPSRIRSHAAAGNGR